jgi:hypothetical protein
MQELLLQECVLSVSPAPALPCSPLPGSDFVTLLMMSATQTQLCLTPDSPAASRCPSVWSCMPGLSGRNRLPGYAGLSSPSGLSASGRWGACCTGGPSLQESRVTNPGSHHAQHASEVKVCLYLYKLTGQVGPCNSSTMHKGEAATAPFSRLLWRNILFTCHTAPPAFAMPRLPSLFSKSMGFTL